MLQRQISTLDSKLREAEGNTLIAPLHCFLIQATRITHIASLVCLPLSPVALCRMPCGVGPTRFSLLSTASWAQVLGCRVKGLGITVAVFSLCFSPSHSSYERNCLALLHSLFCCRQQISSQVTLKQMHENKKENLSGNVFSLHCMRCFVSCRICRIVCLMLQLFICQFLVLPVYRPAIWFLRLLLHFILCSLAWIL